MPKRKRHRAGGVDAQAAAVPAPIVPGLPMLIDEPHLAVKLAHHVVDPSRDRTVVVVTRPSGRDTALVDVADIRAQLGALVDVHEVINGAVGHALSDALPDRCTVYGGASRTYPVGWNSDPDAAPLRFVWNPADAARVTERVISDALHAAHRAAQATALADSRPATGRVLGVAGGRALVALDGGGMAAVRPELTVDGVDAERLFTAGMRVEGQLDTSGRLDITDMVRPAAEALADYRPGDTVLGRVETVTTGHADVAMYPQVAVRVMRDQIIEPSRPARVADLLTEGETVAAVLTGTPADAGWSLDMADVDPDVEPVPAPAILPGGPAWLIPPQRTAADPEPQPEPEPEPEPEPQPAAVPATPDVASAALASMTAERDQLMGDLAAASRSVERAQQELARARTRAREAEAALAQTRRKLGSAETAVDLVERERSLFADPEEQLRFEVQLAWARRIPAAEKAARPLGRYSLGPDFLQTLASAEGVDRSKVIDVIVEIVTGLVVDLPGRELHQLRDGTGGDNAARVRPDGATCWRVSLQVKTPSARRLHFWMLNDGTVELSSVRLHDDFRD